MLQEVFVHPSLADGLSQQNAAERVPVQAPDVDIRRSLVKRMCGDGGRDSSHNDHLDPPPPAAVRRMVEGPGLDRGRMPVPPPGPLRLLYRRARATMASGAEASHSHWYRPQSVSDFRRRWDGVGHTVRSASRRWHLPPAASAVGHSPPFRCIYAGTAIRRTSATSSGQEPESGPGPGALAVHAAGAGGDLGGWQRTSESISEFSFGGAGGGGSWNPKVQKFVSPKHPNQYFLL